jgi:hypothetical protein
MLWAAPVYTPLPPFLWGYPTRGYPTLLLVFSSPLCRPTVPRALAHAAAAWHRECTLDYAADNGHANAIALLVRLGADVKAQNKFG